MYGRIDSPERLGENHTGCGDRFMAGGPKRIAGRRILSRPSAWRRRARDNSIPAFSLCKRPVGFFITLRPFPSEYERVATQDRRERPTASQNPKLIDVERKGRNRAYLHREFHVHCWCLVILEARIASAELIDQRARAPPPPHGSCGWRAAVDRPSHVRIDPAIESTARDDQCP